MVSEYAGRDSGLPRAYLRACLLLLVAEHPVHGYELLGQLRDFGLSKRPLCTGASHRTPA